MSVTFTWKQQDLAGLLTACERNEIWVKIQAAVPRGARVLEHGCGVGQWVRFLQDRGWRAAGVEYVRETVAMARAAWPDLAIVQGDCAASPFPESSFDAVLSLGVVEHWAEGPEAPLRDILRVLKPGGIAIVTVPCLNTVRRLKRALWIDELRGAPAAAAASLRVRSLPRLTRFGSRFPVHPAWGRFFEYRLSPVDFRDVVEHVGFEVVEHFPSARMDGVYHELNPLGLLVRFREWNFYPTALARWLDQSLSRWPFAHPHMQGIVARKPER